MESPSTRAPGPAAILSLPEHRQIAAPAAGVHQGDFIVVHNDEIAARGGRGGRLSRQQDRGVDRVPRR